MVVRDGEQLDELLACLCDAGAVLTLREGDRIVMDIPAIGPLSARGFVRSVLSGLDGWLCVLQLESGPEQVVVTSTPYPSSPTRAATESTIRVGR